MPKGENSIEHLLDVIQEYDQSEFGVKALAEFCLTGLKPRKLAAEAVVEVLTPEPHRRRRAAGRARWVESGGGAFSCAGGSIQFAGGPGSR